MQSSLTPDTISLPFHSFIIVPKVGDKQFVSFLSLPLRLSLYLLTAVFYALLFALCRRPPRGRLALFLYNNQACIHLATQLLRHPAEGETPSLRMPYGITTNGLFSLFAVSSNAIKAAHRHAEKASEHNQFHCYGMFHVKHFFTKLGFLTRKLAVF